MLFKCYTCGEDIKGNVFWLERKNFKVPFCDEDCAHAYELRRKM